MMVLYSVPPQALVGAHDDIGTRTVGDGEQGFEVRSARGLIDGDCVLNQSRRYSALAGA